MKFQDFLYSGVFECKMCEAHCQGHEELIKHYADTHGMNMVAPVRLLRRDLRFIRLFMIWSQPNTFIVVFIVIFFVTKKTKKVKVKIIIPKSLDAPEYSEKNR